MFNKESAFPKFLYLKLNKTIILFFKGDCALVKTLNDTSLICKDVTLPNILKNYQKKQTIKAYSTYQFSELTDFEQIVDVGITTYYAVDYTNNHIVSFNEYWEFQRFKITISRSVYIKAVNSDLYISADNYFYKTDKYLNVIKSSKKCALSWII